MSPTGSIEGPMILVTCESGSTQDPTILRTHEPENIKKTKNDSIIQPVSHHNCVLGVEIQPPSRNPKGGFFEEESQRRKLGGRILEEGSQKGLWGHLQRALEGHPGALCRHLRSPSSHQDHFLSSDRKCAESRVFFCKKGRDRAFRLHGSEATCTKYRACAQKLMGVNVQIAATPNSQSQSHRQNPYSVNTVWGIKLLFSRGRAFV